jgi:holliday junction DNA helicase RuvA
VLSHIKGTIRSIDTNLISVDVHGIGFSLAVAQPQDYQPGSLVELSAYLHWSADNGPSLYGFSSESEKKLFLALISCSGIGPKVALSLIGKLGTHAVLTALASGDQAALSSVSGVGPKKAEQILVQLRSKVDQLVEQAAGAGVTDAIRWKEVSDALLALNYSRPEITKAMQQVAEKFGSSPTPFPELLRHALAHLAKPMR